METQIIEAPDNLNIAASEASSANDFDFLVGKWKIRNRKLKQRLQDCDEWLEFESSSEFYKTLNGFANIDHYRADLDGMPFEGMTVRLFNPNTRLWSIYWADSNAVVLDKPVVGSFEGEIGGFFNRDVWAGKEIICRFKWNKTDLEKPIWSQAFSVDEGKTWEWNWHMHFERTS